MITATINRTVQVAGQLYAEQRNVSANEGLVQDIQQPAALSASLATVNTAMTAGTLSVSSSGITSGQTIDLYWSGGVRYGCLVGTVSGSGPITVPFSGGSGSLLPAVSTAIQVATPTVLSLPLTGNNVQFIGFGNKSAADAQFNICGSGGASQMYRRVAAGQIRVWDASTFETNPLAGDTALTCLVSHGDSVTRTLQVASLTN